MLESSHKTSRNFLAKRHYRPLLELCLELWRPVYAVKVVRLQHRNTSAGNF
ncbi:hypothetical protein Golob_019832 [Gossypium lobatum]|uniref:Uncharacterized protein n=1 Tax=Gossypium lobatum TaxID=34289 RepID=A0A7J8L8K3_9ROSI|nr:hypothetical protein [Gossypium lobatum]